MKKIDKRVADGIILVIGTAVALALFYGLFCGFLLLVREIGRKPEKREIVVQTQADAPEAKSAEERSSPSARIEVYREGDGPAPEWYRPDEPTLAEWYANARGSDSNTQDALQRTVASCQQVKESNEEAGSGDFLATNVATLQVKSAFNTAEKEEDNLREGTFALDAEPDYILDVPLSKEFQVYLHGLCEEAGLPYMLAVAVIEQESHYDPLAISPTNDWGLMQISCICHEWLKAELGITDFLDASQNARAGVYILSRYYAKYQYTSGALVAYNMGQVAAERLFSQGIYETTYSRGVMGIQYRMEQNGR